MPIPDIFRTKLHLTALSGEVDEQPGAFVLRTQAVPNYFHGNFVMLKSAPTDLGAARSLFASSFGADSGHELFVWGPEPADDEFMGEALRAGFEAEASVALALDSPPAPIEAPWAIRPLGAEDLPESFALADACDGASQEGGDPGYQEFKERMRDLHAGWITSGQVTWWGAFEGGTLIGQCGMARCGSDTNGLLGRFQAVEVHPRFQRRGVATALISTVARDAMVRLGCPRILLEADPTGPAIGLYERIGFRRQTDVYSLLRSTGSLVVRAELDADHAGVGSLVEAAFGQRAEADLVRRLRGAPGVISLVAERNGRLLGHVMFSPVTVQADAPWQAMAFAPAAVVPDAQRQGIGSALIRAGLDACRELNAAACLVLGDPAYYGRFDFVCAESRGYSCQWPAPSGAFQILALQSLDQRPAGRVCYLPEFDDV